MEQTFYEYGRDSQHFTLISENKNDEFPTHLHKNIELHYVKEGTIKCVINGTTYLAEKDSMFFIPPYRSHEIHTVTPSESIIIIPSYEITLDIFNGIDYSFCPCLLTDKEFNRNILYIMIAMINTVENAKNETPLFLKLILDLISSHYSFGCRKRTKNGESKRDPAIITQILQYIDEHYDQSDLSLESLGASLGYSKFYLSKIIHKNLGVNFYTFLNTIRLQHFVYLYTSDKNQSFEALSYRCGYKNQTTFYRAFKTVYDMTPKQYFNSTQQIEKAKTIYEHLSGT